MSTTNTYPGDATRRLPSTVRVVRVLRLTSTVLAGLATLAGFVAGPIVYAFTGHAYLMVSGLLVVGAAAAGRMVGRMVTECLGGDR